MPRDIEPDNVVSSRGVGAIRWLLLAIAVAAAVFTILVQFAGLIADPDMSLKVARVTSLSGLLTALAAVQDW